MLLARLCGHEKMDMGHVRVRDLFLCVPVYLCLHRRASARFPRNMGLTCPPLGGAHQASCSDCGLASIGEVDR